MAASFYTRYIPPQEPPSTPPAEPAPGTPRQQKRKREDDASTKSKPAKKQKEKKASSEAHGPSRHGPADSQGRKATDHTVDQDEEMALPQKKDREEKDRTLPVEPEQKTAGTFAAEGYIHKGYPAQGSENASKSSGKVERVGNIAVEEAEMKYAAGTTSESSRSDGKAPKKARKLQDAQVQQAESMPRKHSGVLAKFKQSTLRSEMRDEETDKKDTAHPGAATEDEPVSHGLEPLPQPEVRPEPLEEPSYSSLPSWLSKPLAVSSTLRTRFDDLGINSKLLSNLSEQGYTEAFAIQSALIPLLLMGSRRHLGDICISAATGSGKTLAYSLPLVANLEYLPVPKLRGLIVVPTRELVRQAREACDLCTVGTGLRVGTAVGSASLKEEEQALMRREQVYESFKKQREKPAAESWEHFRLQEYISETNGRSKILPGHVERISSNVDILICTPGRLVDHIRTTKGFTLEHLDWLVIDEADRLLNESFQEWVEVVVRALDKETRPDLLDRADKLLVDMNIPVRSRNPQKVILSATMTQDITKLNSLRLRNPKLVTVREHEADHPSGKEVDLSRDVEQTFTIPPTLKEFTVSVGDGADKPLYLLQLLLSHIDIENKGAGTSNHLVRLSGSKPPVSSTSSESDSSSDESSGSSDASDSSDSSDSESSEASSLSDASSSHGAPTHRNTVLIFTKSSESASRLSRLLSLLHPPLTNHIGTLTKPSKSSTSRKTLTAFRRGKVSVVVATDRASRGLDLAALGHVVNYDVPSSLTTYVHRVGRTARAGNAGCAWTLVAHREGRWFSNEIAREGHDSITRPERVRKANVKLPEGTGLKAIYEDALREVGKEVNEDASRKKARSVE